MAPYPTVLFVCLHGSAKSVIAAAHFRRLAAARGFALESAAAGVEPDADIPSHVRDGLLADGVALAEGEPQRVTDEMVRAASRVVCVGCDLPATAAEHGAVEHWADIPAVSDGYEAAREAIVRRLDTLLVKIASPPRPP